ncbi:MAG TPA: YbaK/EbsC family protein [Actinomycetes bacterium]|nr:YbaK/EbsC family protein [Actinomycetes bacterium]
MERSHPSNVRVQQVFDDNGISAEVRRLPESTHTAAAAAQLLGCDIGAIANSLVFIADEQPILVMASGAARVDTDLLAARIGVTQVRRATADEVRTATGFAIGGVAPVGHATELPTWIDVELERYPEIWAAGGTPDSIVGLTYQDLVKVTGGQPTEVR